MSPQTCPGPSSRGGPVSSGDVAFLMIEPGSANTTIWPLLVAASRVFAPSPSGRSYTRESALSIMHGLLQEAATDVCQGPIDFVRESHHDWQLRPSSSHQSLTWWRCVSQRLGGRDGGRSISSHRPWHGCPDVHVTPKASQDGATNFLQEASRPATFSSVNPSNKNRNPQLAADTRISNLAINRSIVAIYHHCRFASFRAYCFVFCRLDLATQQTEEFDGQDGEVYWKGINSRLDVPDWVNPTVRLPPTNASLSNVLFMI